MNVTCGFKKSLPCVISNKPNGETLGNIPDNWSKVLRPFKKVLPHVYVYMFGFPVQISKI